MEPKGQPNEQMEEVVLQPTQPKLVSFPRSQESIGSHSTVISLYTIYKPNRILTMKLKIPGKKHGKIRIPNFCYIQVIVFDLSYLPVAAVGT